MLLGLTEDADATNVVLRGDLAYVADRSWGLHVIDIVDPANPEPEGSTFDADRAKAMDITGDLAGKRGRILGQDMLPGNLVVIKAQVPLAEVTQYNSQLKSVTGGRGSYSMTLSHYEVVPSNVQQQIVAAYAKKKQAPSS